MTHRIPGLSTACLLAAALCLHGAGEPASGDLVPLKSAAPRGVGPATLPSISQEVLGAASVYGSARPDLFVAARGKTESTLYLFRWLRDSPEGAPIFAPPRKIDGPASSMGTIFQAPDGSIHALWLDGRQLQHSTFDRDTLAFTEKNAIPLDQLPGSPLNVAARLNPDGTVDAVFELRGPSEKPAAPRETNASSEAWRPYDAGGISTIPVNYNYLVGLRFPSLLGGPASPPRPVSPRQQDASFRFMQIAPVDFGPSHRGFLASTRMGNFHFYADPFQQPPSRVLAAGTSGIALRHPSISPSVCAYPNASGQSDLIAAGEGGFYFYRFADRFTPQGAPVFENPTPVLQEDAFLFPGKLPTLSVADWDGDGALDIVAGNSEGFVLFFKNIGSTEKPAFLPGERIQADGEDIHIQAGYSGSVQGLPEARWGYTSPTVADWNEDGLPDLLMGDITGSYTLYLNRGTKTAPALAEASPLYCDGIDLHGMWRSRPAVAKLGNRMALAIVDGEDHFRLYWKIDDYNLEDGGKLPLADGSPIVTSYDPAGGTGRCKLDFFDYDGDGTLDLVIGTGRRSSIPDKQTGYPLPVLGKRTLGTPLFMKNIGSNEKPVFAPPAPFRHEKAGLVQAGGSHETGAIATPLGGDGPNLLVGSETGYLYLLRRPNLSLMTREEASQYHDRRNPLPAP